jgi:hypothetical protein
MIFLSFFGFWSSSCASCGLGFEIQTLCLCVVNVLIVDVSYAAPQAHGIVNVALHREYSPGIVFIFS